MTNELTPQELTIILQSLDYVTAKAETVEHYKTIKELSIKINSMLRDSCEKEDIKLFAQAVRNNINKGFSDLIKELDK